MTEQFEYNGLHFCPRRKFEPKDGDYYDITHRLRSDKELGMTNYDFPWKKRDYNYDEFYRAAKSDCDIFICIENGKPYIPTSHELQEYKEQVKTRHGLER